MFNPSKDLTAVIGILINDDKLLDLLDLKNKDVGERAKKIIKRSTWSDLVTNEKRLCVYFLPARKTGNIVVREETLQIDCHVSAAQSDKAYKVQERVYELLHHKKINCRNVEFYGQLGELATMSGFFCSGSRYTFHRIV